MRPSPFLSNVSNLSIIAAKVSAEDDSKETVTTEAVSALIPNAFEVSCLPLLDYGLYKSFYFAFT